MALAACAWLLLADFAGAKPFDAVLDQARNSGVTGLEEALKGLHLVEPLAAWGAYDLLAFPANRVEDASGDLSPRRKESLQASTDSARRGLDLLRLEHLYRHEVAVRAYRKLQELSEEQTKALDAVRRSGRESWARGSEFEDRVSRTSLRHSLFLSPSLEAVQVAYRGKALACWALQRVLVGAVQMYNLDFKADLKTLDQGVFAKFVQEGYLRQPPQDPGFGPGSASNYVLTPEHRVFCVQHGSLHVPGQVDPDRTVRQLAESAGIRDPAILDRCAEVPVVPERIWGALSLER